MGNSITSADGTRLSYVSHGEGSKPLILVHGWSVTGRVWNDLIPHLTSAGRRVIVPDLRGAGDSDEAATDYCLDRYVEDVVAVLEDTAPDGGAALVGHSMGGQLVQLAAARKPELVDHLILVSPVPVDGLALPDDAIGLFQTAAENADARETILKMASPNCDEALYRTLLEDATRVGNECIYDSFETWRTGTNPDALSAISAPTLVVASDDPFFPSAFLQEKIVDLIPKARLAHVPGAGHYIGSEKPSELGQLVCSFLRDDLDGAAH